jgi:hypothetical protein
MPGPAVSELRVRSELNTAHAPGAPRRLAAMIFEETFRKTLRRKRKGKMVGFELDED